MEALFLVWMLVAGMKDVMWEGQLTDVVVSAPATNSHDVVAVDDGPVNPPPKP